MLGDVGMINQPNIEGQGLTISRLRVWPFYISHVRWTHPISAFVVIVFPWNSMNPPSWSFVLIKWEVFWNQNEFPKTYVILGWSLDQRCFPGWGHTPCSFQSFVSGGVFENRSWNYNTTQVKQKNKITVLSKVNLRQLKKNKIKFFSKMWRPYFVNLGSVQMQPWMRRIPVAMTDFREGFAFMRPGWMAWYSKFCIFRVKNMYSLFLGLSLVTHLKVLLV